MLNSRILKLCIAILALWSLGISIAISKPADRVPEPFPQSTLESEVAVISASQLILFSPVREVNDEIRSDSMARIPVQGVARLYQVNPESGRDKAREHYRQILQQRDAQILFECSGRNCGRSNVWANQVFNQATLYGRDANQDYLVAAEKDEDGDTWLTLLYTVTRGNRREYVWIEHLQVQGDVVIPGMEDNSARIRGPIIVPWQGTITYSFRWNGADRRIVNDWADQEGSRVVLTGYSALGEDERLEDAMERARRATESLSEVLAKSGVPKDRQTLVIVGPAVVIPGPDRQGNRVEVLVITR